MAMKRLEVFPSYGDFLLAYSDALIAAQNAVVAAESVARLEVVLLGILSEQYEFHRELLNLPQYLLPHRLGCW